MGHLALPGLPLGSLLVGLCVLMALASIFCRGRSGAHTGLFPGHGVSLRKDGGVFVPEGEAKCCLRLGNGREIALRL